MNNSIEARKITFGKYKGKTIIELIVTHIGYIMWCLNNIKSFQLTEEEQILYDAFAIGLIRDKIPMTFPIENLKDFIKDKESLDKLKSPIYNYTIFNTEINIKQCSEKLKSIYYKYKDLITCSTEISKGYTKEEMAVFASFHRELQKFDELYSEDLGYNNNNENFDWSLNN